MSKIARQSIYILIGLLVFTLLFAGMVLMDKNKIQAERNTLQTQVQSLEEETKKYLGQIRDLKSAEAQYQEEIKKLKVSVDSLNKERQDFEKKVKSLEADAQDNQKKLSAAQESSEKMKQRLDEARKERDDLVKKLQEKPKTEIVYKEVIKEVPVPQPVAVEEKKEEKKEEVAVTAVKSESKVDVNIPAGTDEYWAAILRQKATLEVEIQKLKQDISKSSMKIVELSQANANLQLELDGAKKERDQLDQEAKYKMEIVNSLSLELARFRSNKKYVTDRAVQLNDENTALRKQIKELIGVKTSLEKTILNLRQENERIERRLSQVDSFVGNKFDELQSLAPKTSTSEKASSQTNVLSGIELPPIVVESLQGRDPYNPTTQAGYQGKVLSVNESNNFIIVSIGESDGVKIGETLTIYHGADYIARVEVIQVRKDISAADIKEQMKKIQPGDIVR